MQKDKVMGAFYRSLHLHRDSDTFKFKDCFDSAGNSLQNHIDCYETYVKDIQTSNGRIAAEFKANYPDY